MAKKISILAPKAAPEGITRSQGRLDLGIEKDKDVGGVGAGVDAQFGPPTISVRSAPRNAPRPPALQPPEAT
jgi:hypothetical protein